MIGVASIVLGVAVGLLRGGRFGGLAQIRLKSLWLVFVSLGLQLLIFPTAWWAEPPIGIATGPLHVFTYALIAVFVLLNFRTVWPVIPGALLNLIVITANRGFMPASLDALRTSGRETAVMRILEAPDNTLANVVMMSDTTRLNVLGDILAVPSWVPMAVSFSIGDAAIMLGIAWVIQSSMVRSAGTNSRSGTGKL